MNAEEIHVRLALPKSVVLWGLVGLFLATSGHELGSETLTLTTTYPSPVGIYKELITTGYGSTSAGTPTLLSRDMGSVGIGTGAGNTPATQLDVRFAGSPTQTGDLISFGNQSSGVYGVLGVANDPIVGQVGYFGPPNQYASGNVLGMAPPPSGGQPAVLGLGPNTLSKSNIPTGHTPNQIRLNVAGNVFVGGQTASNSSYIRIEGSNSAFGAACSGPVGLTSPNPVGNGGPTADYSCPSNTYITWAPGVFMENAPWYSDASSVTLTDMNGNPVVGSVMIAGATPGTVYTLGTSNFVHFFCCPL